MRLFKFRAWDTELKEMFYPSTISCERHKFEPPTRYYCQHFTGDADGILMEWTGHKDSNNVDIYEGDLLKIQLPMGGFWGNVKTEKTGIVRYEADMGGFIVEWEYDKNQHHIYLNCDIAVTSVIVGHKFQSK